MALEIQEIQCPYCGELIELEFEPLGESQTFVEDCTVCCRPIQYTVSAGLDGPEVDASRSD